MLTKLLHALGMKLKDSSNTVKSVKDTAIDREYTVDELKEYFFKNEDEDINCPNCGSNDKARIIYGLPYENDPMLNQALDKGIATLGGCIINEYKDSEGHTLSDYKYKCNHCENKFHRVRKQPINKHEKYTTK